MFHIDEAVKFGWKTFKANWIFLVTLMLLCGVASIIPTIFRSIGHSIASSISSGGLPIFWYGALLNILASIIFSGLIELTLVGVSLRLVDGKKVNFSSIPSIWTMRKFINMVVTSLLYGLIVVGGLILLILPGIYLAVKFGLFRYGIVDKDLGIIDSLRYSSQITKGSKLGLLALSFVLAGITVLGTLALLVGLLAGIPTVNLAVAYVYRKLAK